MTSPSKVEEKCSTARKLQNDGMIFWLMRTHAADSCIRFNTVKAAKITLDRETIPAPSATKRKHNDEETAISCSVRLTFSLPPYSRVKRCAESVSEGSAERPPKRVKLEEDASRPSAATTSGNGASHSLRCPLAVADPERHSACGQLTSNGAVARHLFQHHRRAPYCPTCWTTFISDTERDGHIRLRECKQAESRHIEGLSVKQLAQLVRYFDLEDDCERTWLRMLRLVAPN